MTTIRSRIHFWLMVLLLLAIPSAGVAAERDSKADLATISTRFISVYARTPHKAGDVDGQFIEDVVVPAVSNVTRSGRLTDAQLRAVIDFLVVSEPLASEEISDIAASLYLSQRRGLCTSVMKLEKSARAAVLDRVRSGLVATGQAIPQHLCK